MVDVKPLTVEEAREQGWSLLTDYENYIDRVIATAKERDRLREALGWYADRSMYLHRHEECPPICDDEGHEARVALGETEGE